MESVNWDGSVLGHSSITPLIRENVVGVHKVLFISQSIANIERESSVEDIHQALSSNELIEGLLGEVFELHLVGEMVQDTLIYEVIFHGSNPLVEF